MVNAFSFTQQREPFIIENQNTENRAPLGSVTPQKLLNIDVSKTRIKKVLVRSIINPFSNNIVTTLQFTEFQHELLGLCRGLLAPRLRLLPSKPVIVNKSKPEFTNEFL